MWHADMQRLRKKKPLTLRNLECSHSEQAVPTATTHASGPWRKPPLTLSRGNHVATASC